MRASAWLRLRYLCGFTVYQNEIGAEIWMLPAGCAAAAELMSFRRHFRFETRAGIVLSGTKNEDAERLCCQEELRMKFHRSVARFMRESECEQHLTKEHINVLVSVTACLWLWQGITRDLDIFILRQMLANLTTWRWHGVCHKPGAMCVRR